MNSFEPNDRDEIAAPSAPRGPDATWRAGLLVVLVIYAAGMSRDVTAPWIGMHDWNGAFYSQLARNLLRYPFEAHHGMPIVAAGPSLPPPEERSIYATHPPALVWILAATFRIFGESEALARLTAILASVLSLWLWMWLVRSRFGTMTALMTGLIYSVLPVSVFFGRMVNHEAYNLLLMLIAVAAYPALLNCRAARRSRIIAGTTWALAIIAAIWIDWPGMLLAALFALHGIFMLVRGKTDAFAACFAVLAALIGSAAMLIHLVYGGLEGRWENLWAIFRSRSGSLTQSVRGGAWIHTMENLTLPVMVFAAIGIVSVIRRKLLLRHASSENRPREDAPAQWSQSFVRAATDAQTILFITALAWILIFWRQYRIHSYWMFYLGPFAALWAAEGILGLRAIALRYGRTTGLTMAAGCVAAVLIAGHLGTRDYFSRRDWTGIEDHVAAWKQLHESTPAEQRLILPPSYIHVDQYGSYRFRNITPPQMAYYADRSFSTSTEIEAKQGRP